MKSKFTKILSPEKEKDDHEHDDESTENEEGSEVDAGGPNIATSKKNRIIIIAVASIVITIIVYFAFFKEGEPEKIPEKLQEVVVPPTRNVASDESGKASPFEIDLPQENSKSEDEILDKPAVPQIPLLPDSAQNNLQNDDSLAPPTVPQIPGGVQINQIPQSQGQNQNDPLQNNPGKLEQSNEKKHEAPKDVDPRYSPIIVFSGGAAGPDLGVGYEKNIVNLNEDPIAKLDKLKPEVRTSVVTDRSHSIVQGKLLTAVLETAINTQIPGSVRAIISRDVYAEAGNEVLIPKGSRLYGSYSSQIVRGQGRVDITWSRLIRPDGVSLSIAFKAADQFGRSGISGEVDNKYSSVIAGSLLTSVLAVSTAAAANKLIGSNANVSTVTTNGFTTTTGSAANQAVADVSKTIIDTAGQIVSNAINTTPVISVPQGTKITVIANADMNIPSMRK